MHMMPIVSDGFVLLRMSIFAIPYWVYVLTIVSRRISPLQEAEAHAVCPFTSHTVVQLIRYFVLHPFLRRVGTN